MSPELIIEKRAKSTGPVYNGDGIPYDYVIIIDAGSSGSRAYVYNWLNPKGVYDRTHNLSRRNGSHRRIKRDDDSDDSDGSDDDGDDDDGAKKGDSNSNGKNKDKKKPTMMQTGRLSAVRTNPKWHKKIKPGISSYNTSPGKVGKEHIKLLLDGVEKIVPKSQHSRTPVFLHATAGMRLLKPQEQEDILSNICSYIQKNYDFYLPDCASHVNIIDGDVEGLLGWISVNYLMGSFDEPSKHDHGKNHSTYGLLDMGGASTQISFQPNSTEEAEHANALFKVQLASSGHHEPDLNYNVFSTSFLGFGMHEAHESYLQKLKQENQPENELVTDPCFPKGLSVDGDQVLGVGNFSRCMDAILPLLVESENSDKASCPTGLNGGISSCLLSNSIPSLDFEVDKFIGVSGYWDAISHMLGIDNISSYGNAYSYESFYAETERICETPWSELDHYNDDEVKTSFGTLTDDELAELCFKSSWILQVLHRGLGFPKLEVSSSSEIAPFQVAEAINGSDFSWTIGRAVLYSVWESANFYAKLNHEETTDVRVGYYHASSPSLYTFGGEISGIGTRPAFTSEVSHNGGDDDDDDDDDNDVADWDLDDVHHHYASFIVLGLLLAILYALLGPKKRGLILKSGKRTLGKVAKVLKIDSRYTKLSSHDLEMDDLTDTNSNNNAVVDLEQDIEETFHISDEE